jgi:hypothetical protein
MPFSAGYVGHDFKELSGLHAKAAAAVVERTKAEQNVLKAEAIRTAAEAVFAKLDWLEDDLVSLITSNDETDASSCERLIGEIGELSSFLAEENTNYSITNTVSDSMKTSLILDTVCSLDQKRRLAQKITDAKEMSVKLLKKQAIIKDSEFTKLTNAFDSMSAVANAAISALSSIDGGASTTTSSTAAFDVQHDEQQDQNQNKEAYNVKSVQKRETKRNGRKLKTKRRQAKKTDKKKGKLGLTRPLKTGGKNKKENSKRRGKQGITRSSKKGGNNKKHNPKRKGKQGITRTLKKGGKNRKPNPKSGRKDKERKNSKYSKTERNQGKISVQDCTSCISRLSSYSELNVKKALSIQKQASVILSDGA